jgi:hypothetical protein
LQAKTQTLKMTIVSGLRIIDSNAQTGKYQWLNSNIWLYIKQDCKQEGQWIVSWESFPLLFPPLKQCYIFVNNGIPNDTEGLYATQIML